MDFFRSGIDERSLREWVATPSPRRRPAGGFFPSPPPAPHRAPDDEATVVLPADEPVRRFRPAPTSPTGAGTFECG